MRLRMRQIERVLLGGRGVAAAGIAWAGLALAFVVTFLLGNVLVPVFLMVFAGVVVVLSRAGTPSRWSRWLMLVSMVAGVASAGFVWWAAGAKIDAADSFTPEPALAAWGGVGLIVFVVSFLGLAVSAAAAVARERRR